ncbi:uncharacterized protein LOC120348698 [Nilaparvata lugens]|uniref:uncharacterized protein LOC120348698 n=1 Tax=Nilaparvata lugens TaxID=108931 RepID=UPI00193DEDE1|nr:uncharacterized protein LOC120348698 [Nilaparvata lugens]
MNPEQIQKSLLEDYSNSEHIQKSPMEDYSNPEQIQKSSMDDFSNPEHIQKSSMEDFSNPEQIQKSSMDDFSNPEHIQKSSLEDFTNSDSLPKSSLDDCPDAEANPKPMDDNSNPVKKKKKPKKRPVMIELPIETSRHKGKHIKSLERDTVLNVLDYFIKANPDKSVDFAMGKAGEATGISKRSVYRLRAEQKKGDAKTARTGCKKRNLYRNSRTVKYDFYTISAIRKFVHSLFKRNVPPTVKQVLVKVNADPSLPNFKKSTMYRLLIDSGFTFEKHSKKSLLVEKGDIILSRHAYLREIKGSRKYNNPIVYVGETYVFVGQNTQKDKGGPSTHNEATAVPGDKLRPKDFADKGPRYVIVHAASKHGFLKNAKLMYMATNITDFHPNSATFEKWFKEQLLPNLQPNSVIVFDNGIYNSTSTHFPNASSSKEELKFWLMSKNVHLPEDSMKKEMLHEVEKVKHLYCTSLVDEMARYHGFRIVRLPPHHSELNPIEYAFNQVKEMITMQVSQTKQEIKPRTIDQAFDAVTAQNWRHFFKYVEKTEQSMWDVDYLQDNVDHLASQLPNSSGDDSDDHELVASHTSNSGLHQLMSFTNDAVHNIQHTGASQIMQLTLPLH